MGVGAHLAAAGLPTRASVIPGGPLDPQAIMAAIRQDKKVKRGKLAFVLVRGIGQAFVAPDIDPAHVEAFVAADIAL
jgi:3-dehydroquinate synthase